MAKKSSWYDKLVLILPLAMSILQVVSTMTTKSTKPTSPK